MKRHPLDVVSLVSGLLFAGFGAAFLAGARVTEIDLTWAWPLVLIVIGGVVLVAGLASKREDSET